MTEVVTRTMSHEEALDRERKYLQRIDWAIFKRNEEALEKARKDLIAFYADTGILDPKRSGPVQVGRPDPMQPPHLGRQYGG